MIRLLFCFLLVSTTWGQEESKYQRKSITHIEGLFRLDASANNLSSAEQSNIIYQVSRSMQMGRFDFNPMPQSVWQELQSQSRAMRISTTEELRQLLESLILTSLSQTIEDSSMSRAETLQSESQKQSFMTQKAKSLDITSDQYQKILNSAYIYVPTISDIRIRSKKYTDGYGYEASLKLGLAWYQIQYDQEGNSSLIMIAHTQSEGIGEMSGRNYRSSYKTIAFRNALSKAIQNLQLDTKKMDQFRLRAQITRGGIRTAEMDLGSKSGIKINQKFRLYDMIQEGDLLYREESGWTFVQESDSNSSVLHLVSSTASIGQSLDEIPLVGYALDVKYNQFNWTSTPDSFPGKKAWKFSSFQGISVGPTKDISGAWGWNHFYVGAQFGMAFSNIDAQIATEDGVLYTLDSPFYFNMKFHARKMFHVWNRLFWGLEMDLGIYALGMTLNDENSTDPYQRISSRWYGNTVSASILGELALSPKWSVKGNLGQQYGSYLEQYYVIDGNESECIDSNLPCFAVNLNSLHLSLSLEYKFERLASYFQRMFL